MVDSCVQPRSFFSHLRKQAKLVTCAGSLSLQPCYWQRRLLRSSFDNVTRDGLNLVRNLSQERTTLTALCVAIALKSIGRELHCAVNFFGRCGNESRL